MEISAEEFLKILKNEKKEKFKTMPDSNRKSYFDSISEKYRNIQYKYDDIRNKSFPNSDVLSHYSTTSINHSKAYSLAMKAVQKSLDDVSEKFDGKCIEINEKEKEILQLKRVLNETKEKEVRNIKEKKEIQSKNEEKLSSLNEEVNQKDAKIRQLELEIREMKEKIIKNNEENIKQNYSIEIMKANCVGELAKKDGIIESLKSKIKSLEHSLEESNIKISELNDEIRKERFKYEGLSNEFFQFKNEYKETIHNYESDLIKILNDLESLEAENSELNKIIHRNNSQIKDLSNKNEEILAENQVLQETLATARQGYFEEIQNTKKLNLLLEQRNDETKKLENKVSFLKSEIKYQAEKLENLEAERSRIFTKPFHDTSKIVSNLKEGKEESKPLMDFLITNETAFDPNSEINEILDAIKENESMLAKANSEYNKLLESHEDDKSEIAWDLVDKIQQINSNIYNLKRRHEELLND